MWHKKTLSRKDGQGFLKLSRIENSKIRPVTQRLRTRKMYHFINARGITNALRGVWHGAYGLARCPAHDDQVPSLSLANGTDGRLLLYCYAGCSFREIIQALKNIGLIGRDAYFQKERQSYFVHKTSCYNRSLLEQFCSEDKTAKQKAERAQKIWKQSQPIKDTLAELYLRKRGITCNLPP